jgi:peptidoglycan/xylan/chitin deacetylase (PgdA/CDA1 family)
VIISIPVSVTNAPVLWGRELGDKQIAISFDDGPSDLYTARILDVLKEEFWPAHFFHQGRWAEKHPELTRRAAAEGHAVGSHSWSHANLAELSPEQAKFEIARGVTAVAKAAGVYTPFFRFPFGAKNDELEAYVRAHGLVSFFWNIDARDWEIEDPSALLDNILMQVRQHGKGIILLHDIMAVTPTILPALIKELKASGFVAVLFSSKGSAGPSSGGKHK